MRSDVVSKKDLINLHKNAPCMDCGKRYPPYVMDFDHVPTKGVKKFNLSRAAHSHRSHKAILEEISKCDLVCANCHRERTLYGDEWIYE